MLHENPLMTNIDVDNWRNLQLLVLESSREKRRIIVIHEKGEIMKFVHSQKLEITRSVDRVDDVAKVAKQVYSDNVANTDFVLVIDRKSVEDFFAKLQDSWKAEEDLDVYVHRMFASLDDYPEGIVTFPGSARNNLGLQWRLGAKYEDIDEAIKRFIPAESSLVFGIFEDNVLWTSLVLGFDVDKKINNITTADPSELDQSGDWQVQSKRMIDWVNKKYPKCSLGIFTTLQEAKQILKSDDKLELILQFRKEGKLFFEPVPEVLKSFF